MRIEGIYIHELVLVYFVINATIIFLINLFTRRNREANRWFHLFYFAFIISFLDLEFTPYLYSNLSWYYFHEIPSQFFFGPLFWLYARTLIEPDFKVGRREQTYFIIPGLHILYTVLRAIYVSTFHSDRKSEFEYIQSEFLIIEGLSIVYGLFFLIIVYLLLVLYHAKLKQYLSNIDRLEVKWLQWTAVGLGIAWTIWLGFYIKEWMAYPDSLPISTYLPLYIVITTILLIIGYRNTMQSEIDVELHRQYSQREISDLKENKYESYQMDPDRIREICAQLEMLMIDQKIYQDSKLTLSDIASKLNVSNPVLSQAINRGMEMNFYDYINRYRVEDVKQMLMDKSNSKYTVIYLAQRAGFNSKSTFNTAFKRITGKNPSSFRNFSDDLATS